MIFNIYLIFLCWALAHRLALMDPASLRSTGALVSLGLRCVRECGFERSRLSAHLAWEEPSSHYGLSVAITR